MSELLCLIPAKGCSTRLPRKNLLKLGDKTLIEHAIDKALSLELFKHVCVSTEDEEIRTVAQKAGADTPFLRPEKLSKDPATIVDVVLHAIKYYQETLNKKFKHVCILLPTSPFVITDDIRGAIELYLKSNRNALMSVSPTEFPPYNAWLVDISPEGPEKLSPCFPDSPFRYTKSTECPKTYRSNGAILILNVKSLLNGYAYQEGSITPFVMPQNRSLDIDTQYEYELAQFMYQKYRKA